MQIKNIILSLAAAVALVQAAPAPAPEAAECPKSNYDLCLDETANNFRSTNTGAAVPYALIYANCGYCMSAAVPSCGPEFATESGKEVEQAASKKCYKDYMSRCKAHPAFYAVYLTEIFPQN